MGRAAPIALVPAENDSALPYTRGWRREIKLGIKTLHASGPQAERGLEFSPRTFRWRTAPVVSFFKDRSLLRSVGVMWN